MLEEEDVWHCHLCSYEGRFDAVQGHLAIHFRKPRPFKHGQVAGYLKHRRRGELACPACKLAWKRYYKERRNGA